MPTAIRNLFLVKSPLQVLNAMEALHHFGLSGAECLLVTLADRKSREQIEAMVRHSGLWPHACPVGALPLFGAGLPRYREAAPAGAGLLRSRALAFQRLTRLARSLGAVERVFLGDYRNLPMRHLANVLPHCETVLLDDGTATLTIARDRLQGENPGRDRSLSKRVKVDLKRRLLGMRGEDLASLTFFSSYQVATRPSDRLIVHAFAALRQAMGTAGPGQGVFFLGSPLSEAGILTEDEHLAQLRAVCDVFAGEGLVYVAHRRETAAWLRRVAELGVVIRHFAFPIEYQIAHVGPRPRVLASFISTALGNCRLIFGDSLEIVALRMRPGTYGKRDQVDGIYHHYAALASPRFRVVSLPAAAPNTAPPE